MVKAANGPLPARTLCRRRGAAPPCMGWPRFPALYVLLVSAAAAVLAGCQSTGPAGQNEATSATVNGALSGALRSGGQNRSHDVVFAEFTGIPFTSAAPLARQLAREAKAVGVSIGARGTPSRYRIAVSFSASASPAGGSVDYVIDIYSSSATRMRRITGREHIPGIVGDPWSGVRGAVITKIAVRIMASIDAWLRRPAASDGGISQALAGFPRLSALLLPVDCRGAGAGPHPARKHPARTCSPARRAAPQPASPQPASPQSTI